MTKLVDRLVESRDAIAQVEMDRGAAGTGADAIGNKSCATTGWADAKPAA